MINDLQKFREENFQIQNILTNRIKIIIQIKKIKNFK